MVLRVLNLFLVNSFTTGRKYNVLILFYFPTIYFNFINNHTINIVFIIFSSPFTSPHLFMLLLHQRRCYNINICILTIGCCSFPAQTSGKGPRSGPPPALAVAEQGREGRLGRQRPGRRVRRGGGRRRCGRRCRHVVTEGAVPVSRTDGQQVELLLRAAHPQGVPLRGLAMADEQASRRTSAQVI